MTDTGSVLGSENGSFLPTMTDTTPMTGDLASKTATPGTPVTLAEGTAHVHFREKGTYAEDAKKGRAYVDGCLAANNPVLYAIAEAKKLWPNRRIACVHSMGTGGSSTHGQAASGASVFSWAGAMLGPPAVEEQVWRQAASTVKLLEAIQFPQAAQKPGYRPPSMIRCNPPELADKYPTFEKNDQRLLEMEEDTYSYCKANIHLFRAMEEDLTEQPVAMENGAFV